MLLSMCVVRVGIWRSAGGMLSTFMVHVGTCMGAGGIAVDVYGTCRYMDECWRCLCR